ncbi:uncharacterized protein HKW66_Vig0081460 [Vigna angularis]|uniref:Uncharacterized protein n=1 Tax=Phaseolus angularis TaxID=3914 RepID=A0A8T0KK04_PHAAN|nr:uncharacterized protein HKW66_Vig0081460 [Vigna angularis]
MAYELNIQSSSNEELTLWLEEFGKASEDEKKKAKTLLAEARHNAHSLQRSNDDLKLDLESSGDKNKDLVTERDNLLTERDSLHGKV